MGDEAERQNDGYLYFCYPRCQTIGLGLSGLEARGRHIGTYNRLASTQCRTARRREWKNAEMTNPYPTNARRIDGHLNLASNTLRGAKLMRGTGSGLHQ